MKKVVGVEVAKTSVVCCVLSEDTDNPAKAARTYKAETYRISDEDIAQFLKLGDLYVLEPTGVYSRIWVALLRKHNLEFRLVNPARVANLRKYYGVQSKSDRYDAFFLALYGLRNYGDRSAFLADCAEELRCLILERQMLNKATNQNVNRLWRALSYEWPEACTTNGDKNPRTNRDWGKEQPSTLWRFIAGEKTRFDRARSASLASTIGCGLSELTKLWARQVCELERQQYLLEQEIDKLLGLPEFAGYHKVFNQFDFGTATRAVLLSRIYPFQAYLLSNGRPLIEWVETDNGRSRRNRSLARFRLSLGMGTVVKQSGQAFKEVPGGPSYARTALFRHVKTKIVMSPKGTAYYRSAHCRYYQELSKADIPHHLAVMKVASRITRDLFRALLAEKSCL